MDVNELRQRIEQITGLSIGEHRFNEREWDKRERSFAGIDIEQTELPLMIPVLRQAGEVVVWEVGTDHHSAVVDNAGSEGQVVGTANRSALDEMKRIYQLLELLLPSVMGLQPMELSPAVQGKDQQARELGQWLVRQLSLRNSSVEIPDEYVIKERLNSVMVPFLLLAESLQIGTLNGKQLEKLVSSYFDRDMLLIPLQDNEWLVLAKHELIEDEEDGRDIGNEDEDTEEDLLTAFALGLYELVASEWVGSFHISVTLPLNPLHGLAQTVAQLREAIHLGRLFQVTEHIHLPWELRLESLLYRIPEEERQRFVESADHHSHLFGDEETVTTLETFFKMDCNVSETAKQLYIHRNTLLYRLDKIKQDTQLDVRRFEDAVLMRLTLLLYKVTKS